MFSKRAAAVASRHLLRLRTGRTHVLLAGRGTAALYATLTALDLHDRPVLLPANTCYIVLWAVLQSGNQPILVDIDPLTTNITPETLEPYEALQPAVVIPAHMYGLPAPMAALTTWARARNVFVIEDVALALGTEADDKPAGAWGDVSILSFGQGKTVDIAGGGALLTDDAHLAAEIEQALGSMPSWTETLRTLNRQWLEIYWALHQYESETSRITELYPTLFDIYGGITRCRITDWRDLPPALDRLDANLAQRAELARYYDARFASLPARRLSRPDRTYLWRYPLLVPGEHRNALLEHLWAEGIPDATRWYPSLQPMLRALAPDAPVTATPHADALAKQIINLPLSPETDRQGAEHVAHVVAGYFETV